MNAGAILIYLSLLIKSFLFVASALFLQSAIVPHAYPQDSYHHQLTEQAVTKRLYDARYWHLLLHYRPNWHGGYTSEVDDPGFFMSPEGKTDPKAELIATLAQFFSLDLVTQSLQPAQCAFIARYQWLKEQLAFDDRRLPQLTCEQFHTWLEELNPEAISLIFPSAYMNNPASMFGHTFLRIDHKGQTESTRILAYTINYAARVPPNAGIEYAVKGIFGGYHGFFSTVPYYMKVKEYRDIDNRDIWEYKLRFNREQIRKLLMHTWELGSGYFDYYFFKENCAYQILSLLEMADPTLHLTDQFVFWTIPVDTIRLVTSQNDLVDEVTFRPSRTTQIKRKRETLTSDEQDWLNLLIQDASQAQKSGFQSLSKDRQAFLLDLAADYLQYKFFTRGRHTQDKQSLNRSLLIQRSALKIPSGDFFIKPFTESPENGHKPARASLGIGWREDEIFEEVSIRAGYHDLLDPDPGYTPDSQIVLLAAAFRHYEKRDQYRLEQFTFADLISLSPIDSLFQTPSWKFKVGMETVRTNKCTLCSNGNFNGGVGASWETQLLRRELYFVFGEVDANVSGAFDEHHRVGGGVTGGVLTNLTEKWKALFSVSYLNYPLGDRSDDVRVFFGQRYTLQQNLAVRTEFQSRDDDKQAVFLLQAYF